MNKTRAGKLLDKHLKPAITFLQLNDWHIKIDIKETTEEDNPGKSLGLCASSREYRSANITLYPSENKTDSDLLDTLYHELGHIYLSMYSGYKEVVDSYFEDQPQARVFLEVFRQVDERGATAIARTLFNHFHPELDIPTQ